jgi:hypothetical protein
MSLRGGFRLAGMKAQIGYLANERFTGQLTYWREKEEIRWKLSKIWSGDANGDPDHGVSERLMKLWGEIEEWSIDPECELKIYFTRGYIKKIEL